MVLNHPQAAHTPVLPFRCLDSGNSQNNFWIHYSASAYGSGHPSKERMSILVKLDIVFCAVLKKLGTYQNNIVSSMAPDPVALEYALQCSM